MKNNANDGKPGRWMPVVSILSMIYVVMTMLSWSSIFAQELRKHPEQGERPMDTYVPASREHMQFSPAYNFSTNGFFSVQVNVDSLGRNIVGDAANEPTIAVDPTNPNKMTIAWRQFYSVNNSFRQAGFAYTTDGGHRWTFPGVLDSGVFRSDPVLDYDSDGNFYYNSLTVNGSDYTCNVYKSTNGGRSWGTGSYAEGGDKQWMAVDKSRSAGNGNAYAFWTSDYSTCYPGSFTRSTNRGATFQSCVVIPDDPYWGTLDTGPNGELYVAGVGSTNFSVAKSTHAKDSTQAVIWDTVTSVNLDGQVVAMPGNNSPNPGGLHGQTWIAVDKSSGSTRGNVYLLCSVKRTSNSDPMDVMFARSTNGGLSWSTPVRVNDDAGTSAWQWFGTMSVAPNGRIDVIWLDTRDNPGSYNSSLYYSYSTNAGVTWAQNFRLSQAFNPHLGWPQQNKMGDYYHMVSDTAGACLAWAATFNNEQDVYYGRISYPLTAVAEQGNHVPAVCSLSQNYPNPFNPGTRIAFRIPVSGFTSLKVFNVLGQEVATLVNEVRAAGAYEVEFNTEGLRGAGSSGVYFYQLRAGSFVETRKMILLR